MFLSLRAPHLQRAVIVFQKAMVRVINLSKTVLFTAPGASFLLLIALVIAMYSLLILNFFSNLMVIKSMTCYVNLVFRVLQHPNILHCLGQCVEAIPFLLVFEYCEMVSNYMLFKIHQYRYYVNNTICTWELN